MITAEAPTTIDSCRMTAPSFRERLITPSGFHTVAPWKYTTLMRLHDLQRSTATEDVTYGLKVSSGSVMFARIVLDDVQGENLPTPVVCPASDGAVAIIWSLGEKQLEAIFSHDRSGSFVLSQGEHVLRDGEVFPDDTKPLQIALEDILAQ